MKRIGVLSDTHGYLDLNLKSFFEDCDEIWHAGDIGDIQVMDELKTWKPVRAVHGNIDGGIVKISYPEIEVIEIEKTRILLIHIAGSIGKYNKKIEAILEQYMKINCIICGHSHILKVQYDKTHDLLYINPGAAGKHGFHHMRTALKFDVENNNIQNLQLIELGKRGQL